MLDRDVPRRPHSRPVPRLLLAVLVAGTLALGPAYAATARAHGVHRHHAVHAQHPRRPRQKPAKKPAPRRPPALTPASATKPAPATAPTPKPTPVRALAPAPAAATVTPMPAPTPATSPAPRTPTGWITTPDATRRVSSLSSAELAPSALRSAVHVPVDDSTRLQSMDGFGAAMTESSAHLLMQLTPTTRTAALRSLFDPVAGAGIDLVRLPLGASDFALSRYTYDDLPAGQTDPDLTRFSLAHDDAEIVPVLREAVQINPALRVMATAWTAPAWMKTVESLVGGSLRADRTDVYAAYLLRAVTELRGRGVPVRFLTLGNEPGHAAPDYPSMLLSATQEAAIATALSGRLAVAGITDLQLIGYDHNWDDTTFPTTLLGDTGASAALAGTAFHCYAGDVGAQSTVHDAAPQKGIWFTECSGGSWAPAYAGNLRWNADVLLLGAPRNWARSVLLWNLALDPSGGPHTGGCSGCRGVLTIDPATGAVTRNVEYDVLAHGGKGVRPGAVRIATPVSVYGVKTVAYLNPDGSHALTAYNSWETDQTLVVDAGSTHVGAPLPAGAVVTLVW